MQVDVFAEAGKDFIPKVAMVVYEQDQRGQNSKTYIESYDIVPVSDPLGDGRMAFEFMGAKPLPVETMRRVAKNFMESKQAQSVRMQTKGILSRHLLYYRPEGLDSLLMIWHVPGQRRTMYLTDNLNKEDLSVFYPDLVLCLQQSSLRVYAVKKEAINGKMKLYRPPFPNCGYEGSVCLGTAPLNIDQQTGYIEEAIAAAEKAFFQSRFSHGGDGSIAPLPGEKKEEVKIVDFWKSLSGEDVTAFPEERLIPTNNTLQDLCK